MFFKLSVLWCFSILPINKPTRTFTPATESLCFVVLRTRFRRATPESGMLAGFTKDWFERKKKKLSRSTDLCLNAKADFVGSGPVPRLSRGSEGVKRWAVSEVESVGDSGGELENMRRWAKLRI